jgi:hypothetical protein
MQGKSLKNVAHIQCGAGTFSPVAGSKGAFASWHTNEFCFIPRHARKYCPARQPWLTLKLQMTRERKQNHIAKNWR